MRDVFSTALKLLLAVFLLAVGVAALICASSSRSARRPATRKLWRKGTCASPRY